MTPLTPSARHLFLACAVLLLCGPVVAQERGGILDGSLIERISDRLHNDLDGHTKAMDRFGGILASFREIVSTTLHGAFWLIVVVAVVYCVRQLADMAKSIGEAVKAWRGKP